MLSKHEAWQIPLSNFLHDTSQRQYCICKDAVEKSWIHWKNTKAHVRKKKTKLKELVGSAQDAIFCHKSEVSTTENKLGKEVNLCWCLTGLVSELNAWWQGNQEITRISDLVCSATGTGLLKRKNPTQWLFFVCSRVECSRPMFLNLISYVAKCNKLHQLAEYRVGFCMLAVALNWDSHTFVPGNLFLTRILSIFESWEAFM